MSDSAQIVTRAFRRLQAIDINEQPSAAEMTHGLAVMTEMINGWQAKGIVTQDFTLVGDVVSGSDIVRNLTTDATKVMVNHNVSGTGIAAGTRVLQVLANRSIQLDTAATADAGAATLTFSFLTAPAQFEEGLVALLAMRLKGDMGISLPSDIYADLKTDAEDGWNGILAGYLPDRKARFDRSIAVPAGTWDIDSDVFV
jgi:hypothetical protein